MSTSPLAFRLVIATGCLLSVSSVLAQNQPPGTPTPSTKPRNVALVVWDDIELIEVTGPAQIFDFTPGCRCYLVAETTKPVRSYFMGVVPQYTYDNCPKPDIVVVPAGTPMMGSKPLNDFLRRVVPEAEAVLSVCNGSIILANAGVLDGHEATAPKGNLDDLRILGKDIRPYSNRRFQESGKFVTADSYFAGVDGALHVVQKLCGGDVAREVARRNLYDWQPEKLAELHAQPGFTPKSRRWEIWQMLKREGVDAAVAQYRKMAESGEPGYDPPLDTMNEANMFTWTGWGLHYAKRMEEAEQWCRLTATLFPDSALAKARLAEVIFDRGNADEALKLAADALLASPTNGYAQDTARRILATHEPLHRKRSKWVRTTLAANAVDSSIQLVPDGEPGDALVVVGQVKDQKGSPIAGATVYAYQTNREGVYSVSGGNTATMGDSLNPRLFGYMKTDDRGHYEFRTIRPGQYPGGGPPPHIHYEVRAPGYAERVTELMFADHPSMDSETTAGAKSAGFIVATPTPGFDGIPRCTCDVDLSAAAPGAAN